MSRPSSQNIGSSALVAVIVPRHRRRDDEVAVVHRRALAVHRRVRPAAFEHETQRALRVTVGRCDFAGQDELHAGVRDRW